MEGPMSVAVCRWRYVPMLRAWQCAGCLRTIRTFLALPEDGKDTACHRRR
jgi:hypothetical protein